MADQVEGSVTLGDVQGVVVGKDENAGGEPDLLRYGGEVSEGGQRIPVPRSPSAVSAWERLCARAGQVVVAQLIGGLGDAGEVLDRCAALPGRLRGAGASSPRACRSTVSRP